MTLLFTEPYMVSFLLDDRGMQALFDVLRTAVKYEPSASERYELGVVAAGLAKAAELLVTPQNWLFLTTYTTLRTMLLEKREWNSVARLGPGAFETISGHVVNVAFTMITAAPPDKNHLMAGVDVSAASKPEEKAAMLRGEVTAPVVMLKQAEQLKNPDAVVSFRVRTTRVDNGYFGKIGFDLAHWHQWSQRYS